MLNKAVVQACDALDGVNDGVLEDPHQCKCDPEEIQCTGADGPSCLTPPQVEAVRKICAGPRNPHTQQQIFPGPYRGSGLTWNRFVNGQRPLDLAADFFKSFVFKDANWDQNKRPVNFHSDVALADRPENLSPMRGIRISDSSWRAAESSSCGRVERTSIPPDAAIDYYNSVLSAIGPGARRTEYVCSWCPASCTAVLREAMAPSTWAPS